MSVVKLDPDKMKTLTIAQNAQESDILDLTELLGRIDLTVKAPDTLTGQVTIQLCEVSNGAFYALQSGAQDILIPAAKCTSLVPFVTKFMKLVSAAPEAAARDFVLMFATSGHKFA